MDNFLRLVTLATFLTATIFLSLWCSNYEAPGGTAFTEQETTSGDAN